MSLQRVGGEWEPWRGLRVGLPKGYDDLVVDMSTSELHVVRGWSLSVFRRRGRRGNIVAQ